MEKKKHWQPSEKNVLVFIAKLTPITDSCDSWKNDPFTNSDSSFSSTTLIIYIFLAKKELTASDFSHLV